MNQLWWYTARASGIVGWALLSAGVLWGLALSTRALGSRPRPSWLLDMHRFLGAAAVVFTGIHVTSLVADSYVHFGPTEVLVPLASAWHPVAVAWGIVAVYLLLAVEVTSLLRRHLSRRLWRLTHLASFPLFTVATIHLLSAGTDRQNPLLRLTVLAVTGAVAVLTVRRVAARRPVSAPAGDPAAPHPTGTAAPPRASRPRGPHPVAWPSTPPVAAPPMAAPSGPPAEPPLRAPVGASARAPRDSPVGAKGAMRRA